MGSISTRCTVIPKTIAHGCTCILHHLENDCSNAVMQCLNGLFTLCEEVVQLSLILKGMMEEDLVHTQPCFACILVQVVNCFIEIFRLPSFRVHNCVVGCNTVRAPTNNFLVTSGLSTHVEQYLLTGQVYKVAHNLPP